MIKIYCCRVGNLIDNSHFDRTFHKPIIQKKYENIRWALNTASLHKNTIKKIPNQKQLIVLGVELKNIIKNLVLILILILNQILMKF